MKGGIQLDEYMYKRILVPLDGSQRAERILPHVRQLVDSYWLHQEPQKNYPLAVLGYKSRYLYLGNSYQDLESKGLVSIGAQRLGTRLQC